MLFFGCGITVYAENAGGSQVLASVASSISDYLLNTNVQMANYPLAKRAEQRVSLGTSAAAVLLGAESPNDVLVGQSATQLVASLALMIEQRVLADRAGGVEGAWQVGDEIVLSDADHETNRGAWTRLAQKTGLNVKHWGVAPTTTAAAEGRNGYAVTLDPAVLRGIVTPKTRVVAFTACSNLLGAYTDIAGAVREVRAVAPGAVVAVDCVAFAPHRRICPREWDVDVAFFSLYKTYGAHVGTMYVSPRTQQTHLARLNHFFLQPPSANIPGMYPFQTSSVQYELNHSIAAVADYIVSLSQPTSTVKKINWSALFNPTSIPSEGLVTLSRSEVDSALDAAFSKIAGHEAAILSHLIPVLLSYRERGVRIVGPESDSSGERAPTVAFAVVDSATGRHRVGTSQQIHSALVATEKIGAQQGHMYAHKLVQSLGLDLADGVVRLSFVHYNSPEEVQRTAELLKQVLDQVL